VKAANLTLAFLLELAALAALAITFALNRAALRLG
jgi:hypothetical protein